MLLPFLSAQRRRQADQAKAIPPLRLKDPGDMITRIMNFKDDDDAKNEQNLPVAGNLQMMELCEGLFAIYSTAAITMYLAWNQELPLMVDATGLRLKPWRGKDQW